MNRYLYVPLLLLAACAFEAGEPTENSEIPEGSTTPIYGPPLQGREMQGRYLLGSGVDDLAGGSAGHHFSVRTTGVSLKGSPQTVAFTGVGSLQSQHGTTADDLILPGVVSGELKIDLSTSFPGIALYRVEYRANRREAWTDPCDGAEAAVFSGSFTTSGLHEDTIGEVSFACADGVSFKCFDWGYRPGAVRASEAWEVHQACTRMARGDYCATGTPHTQEGTLISIFDEIGINPEPPATFFGVTSWPPPPSDFYFEAGWRGESDPAVCLSKLRWANLPLGGYCPALLPDPRTDVSARFCDDYISTESLFAAENVKLFNASRYAILATQVWRDGRDVVSTIDGFYSDPAVVPPVEPYQGVGSYNWQETDAFLLRSLPESIPSTDVVNVDLYADGTRDLLYLPVDASTQVPLGYQSLGWRGMAFTAPADGTVPLTLYENPTSGDWVTTTRTPPATYVSRGTVGHLWVMDEPE